VALIAMIIFIKYPLNDQRFKQIRDETEARKRAVIKVHHEDPKILVTSNYAG
jgi:Na+/melibiose symporter-like transporter